MVPIRSVGRERKEADLMEGVSGVEIFTVANGRESPLSEGGEGETA